MNSRNPFHVLTVGIVIAAAGCVSQDEPTVHYSKYVHVALCTMDHLTTTHISALLEAQGIPCSIWGSLIYTVDVPQKNVDRAKRILWDEAVRRPLDMELDASLDDYTLAEDVEVTLTLNIRRKDLIQEAAYSEQTDFGAVLRHETVLHASKLFPIVISITSITREYLDLDQRYKIGHNFEFVLGKAANEAEHTFFFQAIDGDKDVQFKGSFGSAYDD